MRGNNMTVPEPDVRLAILFATVFAISLFAIIIIIMSSLGNIANHLRRMEFIISKEIILRHNRQVNLYKQQKQRSIAQQEREKRQAALLEIPLVQNSEQKRKERL
jgi:sensor histidine kinase YesM